MATGDLTQKVTGVPVSGEILDLVNTINSMIDQLAIFAAEVKKVAREVGTEGKLGGQAEVGNVEGIWQEITYVVVYVVFGDPTLDADDATASRMSVNTMASNLTTQVGPRERLGDGHQVPLARHRAREDGGRTSIADEEELQAYGERRRGEG